MQDQMSSCMRAHCTSLLAYSLAKYRLFRKKNTKHIFELLLGLVFFFSELTLKVALSQKVQDSFFIANFAIINIPFYYPKLLRPLHTIDKMTIFKTFKFTCFIYLQVQEVGFMSSTSIFIS